MILRLEAQEHYPVLTSTDTGDEHDVPDVLARRFLDAEAAFALAHRDLQAYLSAERRDRTAYRHHAEVVMRRLLRGRRRPHRRSRPSASPIG